MHPEICFFLTICIILLVILLIIVIPANNNVCIEKYDDFNDSYRKLFHSSNTLNRVKAPTLDDFQTILSQNDVEQNNKMILLDEPSVASEKSDAILEDEDGNIIRSEIVKPYVSRAIMTTEAPTGIETDNILRPTKIPMIFMWSI